ncbi:MAG TPA: acyl-CoA synthetase [Acidimicrobiales bacterium]|nr:acyl-CoA synthetase [Acidimicrobiales bacterium]
MQFNLADIFESVADAVGDREALVVGDRRLTYRELDERSNRLAHHLQGLGVGAGDHVGLQLLNGVEFLEGILAAMKLRAVPINVNFRYVADELRYLYDNADLVALLVNREFADRVDPARPAKLKHVIVVEDEYEAALAASSPDRLDIERSPDDIYIIYTGGTTGMPKGVMWRHEDLFFAGLGGGNPQGEPVEKADDVAPNALGRGVMVMFPAPPLMHGAAQLGSLISFNWGQKIVLLPKYNGPDALELIEREKVNTVSLVGDAMARPLAEALDGTRDLSSWFAMSSAGAILSEAVKAQFLEHLPNLMILDSFGATETGFQGSAAAGSSPEAGLRFAMNNETIVVDEELQPVAPGSGIIGKVARCGHVPLGYYNDPEKTAATFFERDGVRWVVPGDMAEVEADGTIRVYGRGSVSINSGGEKIYPEEVEAALKAHPAVFDAVVVGIPDEKWGQAVAAVIQVRDGAPNPSLGELDVHCRERIAGYKVPRHLAVVDQMVRSPAGKADYGWAREIASNAGS